MKIVALRLLLACVVAMPISAQTEPSASDRWLARVTEELGREEYCFSHVSNEEQSWSAPNRAQDFRSRVSASGLQVVPRGRDGGWKLDLSTTCFLRGEHAFELSRASVRATGERVELDHGPLTEWFVNGDSGLEHGWTIALAPRGAGRLWIGLGIGGDLCFMIDAGGRSGTFVDATGRARLRYSGLVALDATGRELGAEIMPSANGVGIAIDDTNAVYPLIVDPLLTGPAWTAESDQVTAYFGWSVSSAGDVNGDGFSDVIVGARFYDNGQPDEGGAFVYLGSSTGLSASAAWTAEGEQASAFFGESVATAGDVNGDGYSDVIVGAELFDNGQTNEGRAFVYLGSSTGLAPSAAWTTESNQANANFGSSVATAGDVNGDGFSDVIVGAFEYDNGQSDEGRAFVYLGSAAGLGTSAAWTAESDQISASFGWSAAPAGDVNGDGYDDVIVGAFEYDNGQSSEGRAFVYLGSSTGLGSSAAWTRESDQSGAGFGASVATAGDVNGDGYGDVVVGALGYDGGSSNEGRAYVYLGSGAGLAASAAWTAAANQDNAFFGYSVATAGDINGDGYSDVIVGAAEYHDGQSEEGGAFVYLGSSTGLSTIAAWTAESDQVSALFGTSVSTAGDVNGDGYSDVIVGSYHFDNGEANEGRAFVFHGSALEPTTSTAWTTRGNQNGAALGRCVALAGDVNGDGFSDVIVGAPQFDNDQSNEGRAFAFLGSQSGLSTTPSWTAESNRANASFGDSVGGAGDVNGDGYSDVIVGAPGYTNGETSEGGAFVYLGSSTGLSTRAVWTIESNQTSASLGRSVATAGDVNGDGFGDVIVGAGGYDNGQLNEGRAFVYLGSSSGLSTIAAWTAEGDSFSAQFGDSVACAGDVNRDGFSDVIVGAPLFTNTNSFQGRAHVYLGSSAGLIASAAWTAELPADGAQFGACVSSAGDVNGDGYSDVVIGASGYAASAIQDGRAYVYLGSEAGVSSTAAWSAEGGEPLAEFGRSVSSAGDVDGNGYGDVVVGAPSFGSGGGAFLYSGSASGLAANPAWTSVSNQDFARRGISVSCAGDVDGDGFSDVIVGADLSDNGNVNAGTAIVVMGNGGRGGWTRAPRQRQSNDAAPLHLLGRSSDDHAFRIQLDFAKRLTGFAWASGLAPSARLEWEVKVLRTPLDGTSVESGAEQFITGAPLAFDEIVELGSAVSPPVWIARHFSDVGVVHWRARIRTNSPLFPVTPWTTIPWNGVTLAKFRTAPMPVLTAR